MANGVEVKLNMRGVREILNDSKVIDDCERRAKKIAKEAERNAREHYDDLGYFDAPMFVTKETRTLKYGNKEVVVFANPDVHSGSKEHPGPPIGDYAQARHSSLTQAMDAGRS